MEPRTTAPRGDIEYFLDGAVEASEMDACTAMTLRLYGDDDAMEATIGSVRNPCTPDSHFRNRRLKCLALADLADTILPELAEDRRAGLIATGMCHLTYEIIGLAETMACWTCEDEIEGGCMEAYRRHPRERGGVTFKRTARRLRSPKFIRRYVKANAPEHADHLMKLQAILLRRAQATRPRADRTIWHDWREQLDVGRRNQDARHRSFWKNLQPKKSRREIRHERRVIRRSLNVATSLLGRDTVSSFLRGEVVKLMGADTMLMLRKRGSLAARGHGALSVAIADRHGATLADLCTYIEDTPTLDQLTGFALWMGAGEDRKVLETANIISLQDGAADHPLIAERRSAQVAAAQAALRELSPAVADVIAGRPGRHYFLTHEQRRDRNQQYWESTKGEWIEAMMVAVIGYRNFPIYKQAGAL